MVVWVLVIIQLLNSAHNRVGRRVKVFIYGIYCPELDMQFAPSPLRLRDEEDGEEEDGDANLSLAAPEVSTTNSVPPPASPGNGSESAVGGAISLHEAARGKAERLWARQNPGNKIQVTLFI